MLESKHGPLGEFSDRPGRAPFWAVRMPLPKRRKTEKHMSEKSPTRTLAGGASAINPVLSRSVYQLRLSGGPRFGAHGSERDRRSGEVLSGCVRHAGGQSDRKPGNANPVGSAFIPPFGNCGVPPNSPTPLTGQGLERSDAGAWGGDER